MTQKKSRRIIAIMMAMVMTMAMMFAMTTTSFAGTAAGSATMNISIYDTESHDFITVDSATVEPGDSAYTALNAAFSIYEPAWTEGLDYFDHVTTTYYLNSFVGYAAYNVDHQYNSDGSGWSTDWGWSYTVNGEAPSFEGEPEHGKAMNQYQIQNGDNIEVVWSCVKTTWDKNMNTITETLRP